VRITFVTPSLACGGAERCVTLLTRGFLARGHDVSVITLYGAEHDFYTLAPTAQRLALSIEGNSTTVIHGLANNLRRLRILRKAIKSTQPDVVISHIHSTNIMTILAVGRFAVPVIAVEHNDPGMNPAGRIWETLRKRIYPRARKLVSVSRGVDSHFSWLPQEQRVVIHNPIELVAAPADLSATMERPMITAMGRLTAQKGFDLLLTAFAKVAAHHPDWGLTIIGDGPLRCELGELSNQLGLSSRVTFTGLLADPGTVLRSSQLFVMASRFEGFPYAALEALASGLPVIYTDCPSGPREIIRDGVDGLLVPNQDVAALANAMDRLMSDDVERKQLAARAPDVIERFGSEKIVAQWEELFAEVSKTKS
jgi:GalNAc-alpha-(1->4)-GalNAc-alpha-(1->3)-diNAcBac-PP-undecaprenol alpha-1,4-N-acetyl-D-galactosaminyltransferase